ncbi:hypothetical protein B0H15DRAFT_891291 [Mycena belliarum]|uniref:Uncharacterized protein n=1 Tax=Mycena belliarum TaxID=1033014 RepID=A0AAD6XQ34_9AGAR|nr:hypothetical protein B0H15DRAFT_891291 [Mycena belliae]
MADDQSKEFILDVTPAAVTIALEVLPDTHTRTRDAAISAVLESHVMPANWKDPDHTPTSLQVSVVLGGMDACAKVELDGTRKLQHPSTYDSQAFWSLLVDCHAGRNYQRIFDRYWGERVIGRQELQKIVDQYLAELDPLLRTYIKGQAQLESWSPDSETEHHEFLSSLNIPLLDGGPDMLLQGLGNIRSTPTYAARMRKLFPGYKHIIVMNTPGSGKTRLSVEGLCDVWGLYLTCQVDVQEHGSTDLQTALSDIENDPKFTQHLPSTAFEKAHSTNCRIASNRLTELLYARLVIMQRFCLLAKELNSGVLLDKHKKYWALLQLKPSSLSDHTTDLFTDLYQRIKGAERNHLDSLNTDLASNIRGIIPTDAIRRDKSIFCVIDEAHSAAGRCTRAFKPRNVWEQDEWRPVLREIISVLLRNRQFWTILLGTGFNGSAVSEFDDFFRASSVMKPKTHETLYDVGGFSDVKQQLDYMKSLMPRTTASTAEMQRVFDLATYWLRGRFRITAAFMRELMLKGFKNPEQIFQGFVSAYTAPPVGPDGSLREPGFVPTGGLLDESATEDVEYVARGSRDFNFERLRNDPILLEQIKAVVSKCYMRNDIPHVLELNNKEYDAAEYGFARLVPAQGRCYTGASVVVDEPLVLLALQQWLREKDVAIHEGLTLRARLGVEEATGANGLREYFAFYLSTVFDDSTPLSQIFKFHTVPEWATKPAKLVSLYRQRGSRENSGGEIESGRVLRGSRPSIALGTGGERDNVTTWLKHEIETPFLFPDTQLGPDILFVLELGDEAKSRIWVAVQSKYSSHNLLNKSTLEGALRSITPSRFCLGKNKPAVEEAKPKTTRNDEDSETTKEASEQILQLFKDLPRRLEDVPGHPDEGAGVYSVLRVVAGWKSGINLHERGNKVKAEATPRKRPNRRRKEKPLKYYTDPERHPVVELDIEYMARRVKMLHPAEDEVDLDASEWLDLPYVKQAKRRMTVREDYDPGSSKRPRTYNPSEADEVESVGGPTGPRLTSTRSKMR